MLVPKLRHNSWKWFSPFWRGNQFKFCQFQIQIRFEFPGFPRTTIGSNPETALHFSSLSRLVHLYNWASKELFRALASSIVVIHSQFRQLHHKQNQFQLTSRRCAKWHPPVDQFYSPPKFGFVVGRYSWIHQRYVDDYAVIRFIRLFHSSSIWNEVGENCGPKIPLNFGQWWNNRIGHSILSYH